MDKITVYGIPNCDTIKKTLAWFKQHNINAGFWDYKRSGITNEKLTDWCKQAGWEVLLNKKSTTWRNLPLPDQEKIINQSAAIQLMMSNTSIIKRPVIEFENTLIVGFNEPEINKQIKQIKQIK